MLHINTKLVIQDELKDQETPSQIKVWIAATHSDTPINYRLYTKEEMQKAVDSWTHPYQKPVLLHHDDLTDAIGRVVDAVYISKEEWNQKVKTLTGRQIALPQDATGGILVKAYITDEGAIKKILGGNYTTVSVGFSAEDMICNICGKQKMSWLDDDEENYCSHVTGEEYDGVVAYNVPLGIEYKEISFVNKPADSYAGIVKLEKTSLENALKEVKTELFEQNQNVNSDLRDNENVNTHKEVIQMEEIKALKDELEKAKNSYQDLEKQHKELLDKYEALKSEYDKLHETLKEEYASRVASLKGILMEASDEEIEALKEKYKDLSIETLKLLEDEYKGLVERTLEDEEKQKVEEDKEETKEEVAEETEEKEEVKEDKEEIEEIKEEDKEIVEKEQSDSVNLEKEKDPQKMHNILSLEDKIEEILGIRK